MPNCTGGCNYNFPLLSQDSRCSKCTGRKPGLSQIEIDSLMNKPQCPACGLVVPDLEHRICKLCIKHYKEAGSVHTAISRLPGVLSIISGSLDDAEDPTVGAIMGSARSFQTQASESRLSQAPAFALQGLAGVNKGAVKNLDAARVKSLRKTAVDQSKLLDSGIRITACLWQSHKNKITQMKEFQVIERFESQQPTKAALDTILLRLRSDFEAKYPGTQELTWGNVMLYAHASQANFSSLGHVDRALPLSNLFKNEFLNKKIGGSRKLENREIEIRLMYEKEGIFLDSAGVYSDDNTPALGSKRKHMSSVVRSALRSKRPSLSSLRSAFNPRPTDVNPWPTDEESPLKLRSAFPSRNPAQIKDQWSRTVPMTAYQFKRTIAVFNLSTATTEWVDGVDNETIELAHSFETPDDAGYIGEGATKRGIYARFGGKEYVLTQPIDGTPYDVKFVLHEEYKLLCQCHAIKTVFDDHAKDRKVKTIPKFYFNFAESILGELRSFQDYNLVSGHFIATLLLPCGLADPKIKKFTGNEYFGKAGDHLTKAIHAFAHFSAVYSRKNLLFCDLQGAPDKEGVMCLLDPQCHTSASIRSTVYWDGGPNKLDTMLREHEIDCDDNWVCKGLKLKDLVVEKDTPSPEKHKNKSHLSYITNT